MDIDLSTRPLGWRADDFDHRDRRSIDWLGIIPTLGAIVPKGGYTDLLSFRGPRIRQVGSSCVCFSIKRAAYISHRLQGVSNPELLAALALYLEARRQEVRHIRPLPALIDRGCKPAFALRAAHDVGFVPERLWPEVPANLTRQPLPVVLAKSWPQRGDRLEWIRVVEQDMKGRIDAIDEGIHKGWVPMYGILVDTAYVSHAGASPIGEINPEDILGGHMQTILKVDRVNQKVLVDNWWADPWGSGDGLGYLTFGLVGSAFVSDVILVKSVPTYAPEVSA
jgi:hypothetical protein